MTNKRTVKNIFEGKYVSACLPLVESLFKVNGSQIYIKYVIT